jgi:TorA maturation chaperone TorD
MSDPGLQEAIRAAGGVTELARRIGISQPSVSKWSRIPAERVLSVEAVTGVARTVLRPDLYADQRGDLDETELARAEQYEFLALMLLRAPDAAMLRRLAALDGDATPLGEAYRALARAADDADAEAVEREYFELFVGVGRGELLPYGSYYQTGFLHERPLARLRDDLRGLGIERAEGQCEPEDHAGILCEIMAGLIRGTLAASADDQRRIFARHLQPWIGRFFADLETAKAARLYRSVGTIGRVFIDVEIEAFALPG